MDEGETSVHWTFPTFCHGSLFARIFFFFSCSSFSTPCWDLYASFFFPRLLRFQLTPSRALFLWFLPLFLNSGGIALLFLQLQTWSTVRVSLSLSHWCSNILTHRIYFLSLTSRVICQTAAHPPFSLSEIYITEGKKKLELMILLLRFWVAH